MQNIFENELKNVFAFEQVNDKFWGLSVPVDNVFGSQTIYVTKLEDDFFRIHDGGETIGTAGQSQNILSDAFSEKLKNICKENLMGRNGKVLYIDATAPEFRKAFFVFYKAITQVHQQ